MRTGPSPIANLRYVWRPRPGYARAALQYIRAAWRPVRGVRINASQALRAGRIRGRVAARQWNEPGPPGPSAALGLRPQAASRSVLAALPPSAPKGLPNQPLLRNGKPTDTKRQNPKRCACGASLKPVLHRRSKRREPMAVKAKPCGRYAALTGSAMAGLLSGLGAIRGSGSAHRCATAEPPKPSLFRDAK